MFKKVLLVTSVLALAGCTHFAASKPLPKGWEPEGLRQAEMAPMKCNKGYKKHADEKGVKCVKDKKKGKKHKKKAPAKTAAPEGAK